MDRNYETGARRDSRNNKGRYDLISPFMLERLAKRLEYGAENYGDRNWEKGIPMQDFYDSAMRHLISWQKNMDDEDHLAAVIFNVMGIMHFEALGSGDYVGSPSFWVVDSKGTVSDSKPQTVPAKVIPQINPESVLGAVTERQTQYVCGYCHDQQWLGLSDEAIPCPECQDDGVDRNFPGMAWETEVIYPDEFEGVAGEDITFYPEEVFPKTDDIIREHTKNQNAEMDRREAYRSMKRAT